MTNQIEKDSRALKAVALQFLINGAVISSIIPRLPEIRDALSVDLASIGQVLTMASVGGVLGSLFSTVILKKIGTKNAMLVGTMITILVLPLVAFASSIWSLFFVLAIIMLMDPIVDIAMNMQGSSISARRDSPIMSRLHGLWSIGSVLGGLVAATAVMFSFSLTLHLLLVSFLMMLALVFIGSGLLDSGRSDLDKLDSGKLESKKRVASLNSHQKSEVKKDHKPIKLWVFGILGGVVFIPELVGSDWSPFRLKDDLQTSLGLAGMFYVVFTCGMVIGRLTGDWLAVILGVITQFKTAIVVSLLGMLMACIVDSALLVFIALFVSGLGISVLFPCLYDMAAQDPDRPERALSIMTAGSRSITLIVPISIGFLADSDSVNVGLAMLVFALPCLLITFFLMGDLINKKVSSSLSK